jgi:hypothetical protein
LREVVDGSKAFNFIFSGVELSDHEVANVGHLLS